jgi:hypothetical protein
MTADRAGRHVRSADLARLGVRVVPTLELTFCAVRSLDFASYSARPKFLPSPDSLHTIFSRAVVTRGRSRVWAA